MAYASWDDEDSLIMSWLWNSMILEINDIVMFLSTAKEIWEYVKIIYSKVNDDAQIYEIRIKVAGTKQGTWSITEYTNLLQILWEELDHYQCIQMKCSEDAAIQKKFVENERTYDFLASLNVEYDAVRI